MRIHELDAFRDVPFLLWAKDADGTYVWGNSAIDDLAGEPVAGKKDSELVWAENAATLRKDDEQVLASRSPMFAHEYVQQSQRGQATLSVCKWADELEGELRAFGISFVIDD